VTAIIPSPTSTTNPNRSPKALCRKQPLDGFFVEDDTLQADPEVRELCDGCSIRDMCLRWALDHPELAEYAVYGGLTPLQRRQLLGFEAQVHCPGCGCTGVLVDRGGESCDGCGLSWRV